MEIIKNMSVPKDYLFEVFTQSIQSDIAEQTGKKIETANFEDFEYIKTFSKNNQATIKIDKFEQNNCYQYSTRTDKNKIVAKYDITAIDNHNCKLRYTEQITSYGYLQKLNDTLVGFVWSFLKKKRFNEMLRQIEESY